MKNNLQDIEIQGHKYVWNATDKEFIISKNAVNEIGCIHTLQGYDEEIYGQSFLVVEKSYNADILDALQSGVAISSVDRTSYNILVLNGTNTNGLAGSFRSDLQEIGYANVTIDNGEATNKSIIICKDSELREILKSDTGISKTSKETSDYPEYDAIIILGEDYN